MSTAELQACLARLYVDEAFRELLVRWPDVALQGYVLSAAEDRAVRDLDVGALQFFAHSLRNKRVKRFRRVYPALYAMGHPHVDRLSARYHYACRDDGRLSLHEDVLNFGRFVEQSAAADDILPPWVSDLVRYERHYYAASVEVAPATLPSAGLPLDRQARPVLSSGVQVASFGHDVVALEEAAGGGGTRLDEVSARDGYTIVFRHRTPNATHGMVKVNGPTAAVIEACDGTRTVPAVVEEVQHHLDGPDDLSGPIVETIEQLIGRGVVVCAEPAARGAGAPSGPARVVVADWTHDESF
jgi:hypothetical protein